MSRRSLTALAATIFLATLGCSSNRIIGHNLKQVGRWWGELGITGHLNEITVQSGSRLTKLSIIGDANQVVIEEHATLGKIEVWGGNNTVSIPEHLVVRMNQVGKGTRIIRRPHAASLPTEAAMETHVPPPEPAAEPIVEPTGEKVGPGDAPE